MDNFEEHLMQKFPDLFPKDKDGKTTYSSCGVGGLESWEPIIEEMCSYLDSYCKNSYRFEKTKKIWPRFKYFLYEQISRSIYNTLFNLVNPYRGIIPKEIKKTKFYVIRDEWTVLAKKRKRYGWQKKLSKFYFSLRPDISEKILPPQVILQQIKSKMNTARIYIDNADQHCYSVASFTEYLCDQIAQKELKIEKP